MLRRIPRAPQNAPAVVVTGALWNLLADSMERVDRVTVAPPLTLADNAAGKQIGIVRQPANGVTVKITGAAAMGDDPGVYLTARIFTDLATGIPPAGMTDPGIDNAIIENLAEQLMANAVGAALTNSHWLPVGTFYFGIIIGQTTDTPPKSIVEICAPNPYADFEVALVTDDGINGSVASDGTITNSTYTYKVTDFNGTILGTGMAPSWNRPGGPLTGPATNGRCYYGAGGGLVLAQTDEQESLDGCGGGD